MLNLTVRTRKWLRGNSFTAKLGRPVAAMFLPSPSFIIVGAQKAGTSALHNYLCQHPDVKAPSEKEIRFFSHGHRYCLGSGFYKAHFPILKSREVTFDATPSYLYYPKSAQRIKSMTPNAKILVALRDPVERAYSQWNMYSQLLAKDSTFNFPIASKEAREALVALKTENGFADLNTVLAREEETMGSDQPCPEPSLLRRGLYLEQLKPYFELFGKQQVMLIESNELKQNTHGVLQRVLNFLELAPHTFPAESLAPVHKRAYQSKLDPANREKLARFFQTPNQNLFEFIGTEFDWSKPSGS